MTTRIRTRRTPAAGVLGADTLRVRMYRVGFGDCFLVSLPNRGMHSHVLVDCGVHGRGDIRTMEAAVENIARETNRHLSIVIASHAHQDHISGFSKYQNHFAAFDIDEVWLPWTEDPSDREASRLRRKHLALVEQLDRHFAALPASADNKVRHAAVEVLANLSGNQAALQALRTGFGTGATVRYLNAGEVLKKPADIPALFVRVLGPPRDPKFLSKMDPPAGQRYLRAGPDGAELANALSPFVMKWRAGADWTGPRLTESDEREVRSALAEPSLEGLAFALDQVRNNTSLATLLVFRGQYLLFPGDAQYGNWRYWLDEEGAADILSRVTFLKVSHHGSHNATPRDALEQMTGSFAAMVSTQNTPWDSIPRKQLMKRLEELTRRRVVRSDSLSIKSRPDAPKGPAMSNLPQGFSEGEFWYDYTVKVG